MKIDRNLWFGGSPLYRMECTKAISLALKAGKIKRAGACQSCSKPGNTVAAGVELTATGLKIACWLCPKCFSHISRSTKTEIELCND